MPNTGPISYNLSIPNAPNDPSADQPLMQINTNSISTLTNVDHYTFASNSAGQHKQVTYPATASPGAQVDPASIAYTSSGLRNTNSQQFYKNADGTFMLNCIRAFASFVVPNADGSQGIHTGLNIVGNTVAFSNTLKKVVVPIVTTVMGGGSGDTGVPCILSSFSSSQTTWNGTTKEITFNVVTPLTPGFEISLVVLQA